MDKTQEQIWKVIQEMTGTVKPKWVALLEPK